MDQLFHIKWNTHQETVGNIIKSLDLGHRIFDAVIVTNGNNFWCHKLVLALCSPVFLERFKNPNFGNQPMHYNIPAEVCQALLSFMYVGHAFISNTNLQLLLNIADRWQIKGFAKTNTGASLPLTPPSSDSTSPSNDESQSSPEHDVNKSYFYFPSSDGKEQSSYQHSGESSPDTTAGSPSAATSSVSCSATNNNIKPSRRRTYTKKSLEEGIEDVLTGTLTPTEAYKKYNVPERTFYRRLKAARIYRGIPSTRTRKIPSYNRNVSSNGVALQPLNRGGPIFSNFISNAKPK